jgi:spore coat polysaccharide biosynthesis protein SpsF
MDSKKMVVAIIQARMGSSRLPGKVLKEIGKRKMLGWVVERVRRAEKVDKVVVATTKKEEDEAIVKYCAQEAYPCHRGPEYDVLDRFYKAAKEWKADMVVRITADCPFIDPGVIDKTLTAFFKVKPEADFAANRLPPPWKRTYPVGLDTEVVGFKTLEEVWLKADEAHQREHVMPYIYEHPDQFKIVLINSEKDYSGLRWTVDTEEDLRLVREIAGYFGGREDFSWKEIIELYQKKPALKEINADVQQKKAHDVDKRMGWMR